MNRGKHKVFVTVTLVVASIVVALLLQVIGGSSGGAETPKSSGSTSKSAGPGASLGPTGVPGTGVSFRTVGTNVNLRSGPSTGSAVVVTLTALGSPVTLTCYLTGSSVGGDPWWYRASYLGRTGYVSGYWVNTGPDPAKTRLPAC